MSDMRNIDLEEEESLDPDTRPPPYSEVAEPQHKTGFDKKYAFSAPAALKYMAAVLCLIGFVAALADFNWGHLGGWFVQYATVTGFITTLVLLIIRTFRVHECIWCNWELSELIYLCIYILKMFIAAVIAGVHSVRHPGIMTACVICGVAFFLYLLDCIMSYQRFQLARSQRERSAAEGRGRQPVF